MADVPVTRRFRGRLTIAFVLVVAISTGVLAVTSWALISGYRTRVFVQRAEEKAALSLISTPQDLTAADVDDLLAQFQVRGGFETVVAAGGVTYSSVPGLGVEDVPASLRDPPEDDGSSTSQAEVDGEPTLVIAGARGEGTRLWFFFAEEELRDSIDDFRTVLAIGWLTSVAGAAAFGSLVARRTLRPVDEAARASEAVAEGLLDTRLDLASDDEFGRLAASFNTMATALEEKIAALSESAERERQFTADVAHELRTPLTGMVSAASLLEANLPVLGPAAPAAELLVDDVRRLRVLVDELLELARFDAGQERAALERTSLGAAIATVVASWDGRDTVAVDVEDGVEVMADRARFRRVLGNLIANARSHGGGTVEVRGHRDGDRALIEVLDDGPGISPDSLERIFDRFHKGDPSRSAHGSGLGLAIALENARLQGGDLRAGNRPEGGACFAFSLPAAPSGVATDARASSETRTSPT